VRTATEILIVAIFVLGIAMGLTVLGSLLWSLWGSR
jgi:hypothetical protein